MAADVDQYVAEIRIFAFNFAPTGWAQCNGQLLPISQNTALFSLLGTTYGGDGKSTFALPDLQGAIPLHVGDQFTNGPPPGLSTWDLGQSSGVEFVTLLQSEIPIHTHSLMAKAGAAATTSPSNAVPSTMSWVSGTSFGAVTGYSSAVPADTQMNINMMALTGGSQPHNNLMPYLTLNFCIALQGIFPPRG
jgi:microcystin-dependent protein